MTRMITAGLLLIGLAAAAVAAQEQPTPMKAASPATAVNINTATMEQLESLPGIGPATVQRIVEYRQKNGGFKKPEDILESSRSGPVSIEDSASDALSIGLLRSQEVSGNRWRSLRRVVIARRR